LDKRDANGRHAIHYAALHGHVDAAAAIYNVTDGNLYARDAQERTALHLACLEGHTGK
jgi:ankyrin repeat protein